MVDLHKDGTAAPQPFESPPPFVWLASFPRSGNTLLRTILWNCFALRSASVYPNDLGQNHSLEETVGHIEHDAGKISFPPNQKTCLVKTHEHKQDAQPAIYVVRDGRTAIVSLWEFYDRRIPLKTLIEGTHQFGKWQDHLQAWDYSRRPKTLFLRYEDLLLNLEQTLKLLSDFLQHQILSHDLPARESIANQDGRWVRSGVEQADTRLSGDLLELFNNLHAEGLKRAGYQ
jgi:hypothetical protein